MEIKVNVELGLTPQLAKMVERFFCDTGCFRTVTVSSYSDKDKADAPEQPEQEQPGTAAEPWDKTPKTIGQPETAAEPLSMEPEEIPHGEVPTGKVIPIEITPPTDQEMRDLMDIAISKLAGNGWKESGDPKTVAVRKGCTKAFKQIAAHLGAEKPTALRGESRIKFIKHLDEIFINTKDNSVEWKPF